MTTEHFTLQGARSATIAESTGGVGGRWQQFRTVAGMVAVVTAVLAGSAIGLLAAVVSDHSLVAALAAGGVVAVAVLGALMRYERFAWERTATAPLTQT